MRKLGKVIFTTKDTKITKEREKLMNFFSELRVLHALRGEILVIQQICAARIEIEPTVGLCG
jgi:hypothetical protein